MTDDTKPAAPADAQPVVCNRAEDAQPMAWCYVKEGVEGPCFNGRGRRFETYNEGWTEVPLYSADALAALRAERDELLRLQRANEGRIKEMVDEELLRRAERAERDLAAAQAALAAAHDALTEIALAGMSLPMVCGDDEETKNRFHARRAWEFIGIAARAKTEIDAARAAAGGGK